ncbi:membrane protein required for colicin V production [Flavobacteriaceae bacterium MAR_2010_72]|nr:membrane protein required for colicin V production [Flavobacteriaceae bacterium MAR_2010_72]TVZ58454.1 membrane protein required for colicin V production [Flavobacteriaceae bacterium MAR_2010_105]
MTILDIILLALLLFGLIRGFIKGFFVEVASLLALVAGVYGAIHFSNFAADFLMAKVDWNEKTVNITAFAITFIVIVMVIALAGKALTKLADFAALGLINKVLGAVFGTLKIAVILSVVLIIFDSMNKTLPFTDEETIEESMLYEPVKALVPTIFPIILEKKEVLEEELLPVDTK